MTFFWAILYVLSAGFLLIWVHFLIIVAGSKFTNRNMLIKLTKTVFHGLIFITAISNGDIVKCVLLSVPYGLRLLIFNSLEGILSGMR